MSIAKLFTTTTQDLLPPSPEDREELLALPPTIGAHHAAMARLDVLRRVETGGKSATPAMPGNTAKISFWNAERLKYVSESTALQKKIDADIILLAEVDIGMARSSQRHTARDLAHETGMSFVYATEFVELGLGDARERAWHAGAVNSGGLHGGAILSRLPLTDPAVIRFPEAGDWFDGSRGERRIGGRIALVAKAMLGQQSVAFAAIHLESHGNPASRAVEIEAFIPTMVSYAGSDPILLGGDFNTNTTDRDVPDWDTVRHRLESETPGRLTHPEPYEPMFEVLRDKGFDWRSCNSPGATQRTRPDGTPKPPFSRLDWLFCRDLVASHPASHRAVAPDGKTAISDHDALSVQITPKDGNAEESQT